MKIKKLTHKENGWVGTEDKKYAVHATENGITIVRHKMLSSEYEKITIYDIDILKEAVKLYEDALNANQVQNHSHHEKHGDTLTQQCRQGAESEKGKASNSNDLASDDNFYVNAVIDGKEKRK